MTTTATIRTMRSPLAPDRKWSPEPDASQNARVLVQVSRLFFPWVGVFYSAGGPVSGRARSA